MKSIKEKMIKKSELGITTIKIDKDVLNKLKAKLKKDGFNLSKFFRASAEQYLNEK